MAKTQRSKLAVHTKRLVIYSIIGVSIPLVSIVTRRVIEWVGPENIPQRTSYGKYCKVDDHVYMTYLGIPNMILSGTSLLLLSQDCFCLSWAKNLSSHVRRSGVGNQSL